MANDIWQIDFPFSIGQLPLVIETVPVKSLSVILVLSCEGMLKDFLSAVFRHTPASLRRCLSRFRQARFTISVGAVITNDQGDLLLLEHVFRAGSGWGIPGGFIAAAEQPEAALRRELREEVGLELEHAELAFVKTMSRQKHLEIVFRCRAQGPVRPQSLEVKSAAWFPLDALPETLSADQRQLITRALADRANRPE
jgi:ADP-ribose pyrophosphatase YjhB (NUDIX family)